MSIRSFQFGTFTLDLERMSLNGPRGAIDLRPKSFDVLRYLVEHAGRVASKDEVMASVWADVVVTEDSLTRCISEIRTALGDDSHSVIKTLPKRGYMLDLPVAAVGLNFETCASANPAIADAIPPTEQVAYSTVHTKIRASSLFVGHFGSLGIRSLAAATVIAVLGIFAWLFWPQTRALDASNSVALTMMAAPTVMVLPFVPPSADRNKIGLASSLDEEIRSALARTAAGFDLVIMARPSEQGLLRLPKADVGALGVRYVARGTAQVEGDRLRVNVQLIESGTNREIWAHSVDAALQQPDLLKRLSAQIARAIAVQVRHAESRRPLPATLEPGHYVQQGRKLLDNEPDKKQTVEAGEFFERALALDASYVPALIGLARTQLNQYQNAWAPWTAREEILQRADDTIERLVKLAPQDATGHYLRGSLLRSRGDPDGAIAAFEYALVFNPTYALAFAEIGRAKIDSGRAHETIGHIEAAVRLSPTDPHLHIWYFWAGLAAVHVADNSAALAWLLKARQANRNFRFTLQLLAVTYQRLGEEERAQAAMSDYLKRSPGFSLSAWRRNMATSNPIASRQRRDIEDVLHRLGVREETPAIAHTNTR